MGKLKPLLAVFLAMASWIWAGYEAVILLPDPWLVFQARQWPSVRIEDRNGRLLRELLSSQETRAEWVPLTRMSRHLKAAALAAEDHRFYHHPGFDLKAVLRAAFQNLKAGRIVSGASTITMQLARTLTPGPRTWSQKITEAILALRLEKSYSKDRILEAYLNLVPCGNNTQGLPAAARMYYDKSPANVSPAEAAFLMALPQAPGALNPYRSLEGAQARRNRILTQMAGLRQLTADEAARAKVEPIRLDRRSQLFRAPHFVTHVKAMLPDPPPHLVQTTLDLELQSKVEALTMQALSEIKNSGVTQAAVVVLDHHTREVLAWVGSGDFFNTREGQNDGVTARRQPGSAIKPFTYAAAFDAGLTPATIVEDSPVEFGLTQGVYKPVNYDGRYHGRVDLRTALASSLNVPAVKVLDQVGLTRVYQHMKAAGLTSLTHEPEYYGLGLTLGAGEVSLLELTNAYATLAAGGRYHPPLLFSGQPRKPEQQAFSPAAAYMVTDILSDDTARATGFGRDSVLVLPFPCAAKTGTSKNFRDNWTVGFSTSVVVGVWAGNFDAKPMGRVSGITGAGPLWHQVMRLCAEHYPPQAFTPPDGLTEILMCPETGLRSTNGCPNQRLEIFKNDVLPSGYCLRHQEARTAEPDMDAPAKTGRLTIFSPRPGERYLYDPGLPLGFQNLELKAGVPSGLEQLVWSINGQEVGRGPVQKDGSHRLFWPLTPGEKVITVEGLTGKQIVARDMVKIMVH